MLEPGCLGSRFYLVGDCLCDTGYVCTLLSSSAPVPSSTQYLGYNIVTQKCLEQCLTWLASFQWMFYYLALY